MYKITAQLDELIREGEQLAELGRAAYAETRAATDSLGFDELYYDKIAKNTLIHRDAPVGEEFHRRRARWFASLNHILKYLGLTDHLRQISNINQTDISYASLCQNQVGVLESARTLVEAGLVGKLRHLLHADLLDSLLDEANHLQETGHLIPAAVLGRIVIEGWLRDQAESHGIADHDTKKASILNDELKKETVYSTPRWRKIQSHLDVGNSAAHGKTEEFTHKDVEGMIAFAKAHCC